MVSVGSYILGIAMLVAVGGSVGFSAFRIRRHLLPGWNGAPARLIEAVLAVALLIWLCELLGLVGLLYASTLVVEALLLAAAIALWPVGAPSSDHSEQTGPPAPSAPAGMTSAALAAVFLVFAHWGIASKDTLDHGISNFDSLWYHMPFAVEIVQSHSVTGLHYTDTVYTNWFYPQNSELLHAAGVMLTERDTLSVFVNFGWLGLAFLAAWCVGRPYGRGPLCVVAAAIALGSMTLLEREPGAAKNDVMAAALVLAAASILVNAWAQRSSGATEGERRGGALVPGWPLAAAGLAAGLAAGSRATALAIVALLSLAAVALAPPARHRAAAAWWLIPALAGGGFWYVRNLIAVGNPLPQVESLGPLSLPHPEQVQSGRPDFGVIHYATDTAVWSDYFAPGLEHAFGSLWPLIVVGAILGGVMAAMQRRDRAMRWLGVVALGGIVAYLFTPLGAAGIEGAPVAFVFNLRFVVPALLIGLVLLPLAREFRDTPYQWALLAGLLAVLLVTDGTAEALANDPDRLFGLLLGVLLVVVPSVILLTREREDSRLSLVGPLCVVALVAVAIGYGLQRDYGRGRFDSESSRPGFGLDSAYAWTRDVSGARIGLAGTVAGLQGYGFYGPDLSNRVRYLGERGPRGAFNPIPDCGGFRDAVNSAGLDYLVTAPFLNFVNPSEPIPSPEARWLAGESAVEPIAVNGDVTVWRVDGTLEPGGCGAENAPLRETPRQALS